MIPDLVTRVVERGAGDHPALVFEGTVLSYSALADAIEACAANIASRGVGPGDRVLYVAENSAGLVVAALAAWRLGAVVATAYATSGTEELKYIIGNADPLLILAGDAALTRVNSITVGSGYEGRVERIAKVLDATDRRASPPRPVLTAQDVGYICYTSGTSSHPKPVAHSQIGLLAAAELYARTWHLVPSDRVLVSIPLAWAFGLITSVVGALSQGATSVIAERFRPDIVFDLIRGKEITVFPGVTTMFVKLLAHHRETGAGRFGETLRFCLSGGEPRNEAVFSEWTAVTGCPVHDVYAATESFPAVTYDPTLDRQPRTGSAGKVLPDTSFRLVDPNEDGEGEAHWRGVATMIGYWRLPEMTKAALTDDGWYRSGDRVRIDSEGYVFVLGRNSDLIIRGGSNVSPAEVESVLNQHPSVERAVVVGLPDPGVGQIVAAAIILAPGCSLDEAELQAHCKTRLSPFKVPSIIRAIEALPTTVNGKIKRSEIVSVFLC